MRSPCSRSCSPDSPLLRRSWNRSWSGLAAERPPVVFGQEQVLGQEVFEALCERYSESTRKYHTLQHLGECLGYFEQVRDLAQHPAEVETALWFHDAIYELAKHDNEAASASWAESELARAGVETQSMDRIKSLIMATCHSSAPIEPDQCLLVDIDLSILGASDNRFQEYERQIREEYSFVPETIFIQKRREILKSFLDRPRIYSTHYFFDRLESLARRDLTQAVRA